MMLIPSPSDLYKLLVLSGSAITTLNKGFKGLKVFGSRLDDACNWLKRYWNGDECRYNVDYKGISIQTLLTSKPEIVTRWCKVLEEEMHNEGVPRFGSLYLMVPRADNGVTIRFRYLILYIVPNQCLIFRINSKSIIPNKLNELLESNRIVYFMDSIDFFSEWMTSRSPRWKIPPNFIDLKKLLNSVRGNNHFNYLTSIGLMNYMLNDQSLKYMVKSDTISSDWGRLRLGYLQVEYLVMCSFACYIVAAKNGYNTTEILIQVVDLLSGSVIVDMSGDGSSGLNRRQ